MNEGSERLMTLRKANKYTVIAHGHDSGTVQMSDTAVSRESMAGDRQVSRNGWKPWPSSAGRKELPLAGQVVVSYHLAPSFLLSFHCMSCPGPEGG